MEGGLKKAPEQFQVYFEQDSQNTLVGFRKNDYPSRNYNISELLTAKQSNNIQYDDWMDAHVYIDSQCVYSGESGPCTGENGPLARRIFVG